MLRARCSVGTLPTLCANTGMLRRPSRVASTSSKLAVREDDFPYARIPEAQFQKWSESTSPLPLKAFFAQHRPLLTMHPGPEVPKSAQDVRDIPFVHVWEPQEHFVLGTGFQKVPQEIAQDLGAFDVGNAADKSVPRYGAPTREPALDVPHAKMLAALLKQFNNTNGASGTMAPHGSLVQAHVSFIDGQPVLQLDSDVDMEATSVRRKRKLKMNRHKYRKRLKEQRTQRRRLGK